MNYTLKASGQLCYGPGLDRRHGFVASLHLHSCAHNLL